MDLARPIVFWPLAALALGALATALVLSAWQCDDAFITFRTVENLFAGHGLRWNPDERVQAYTHPLWLLFAVVCRALFGELYISMMVVGGLLALASAVLLMRLNRGQPALALAVVAVLVGSKAFVDYGTGGLENPLTGVLVLALVFVLAQEDRVRQVPLVASLLVLTRPDALLLALPAVIWSLGKVRTQGREGLLAWVLGWTPLVLWELFSLIYYGSPIPNTAWAKLNVDIERSRLLSQGMHYLLDSLDRDPITLLVTGLGLGLGLLGPHRRARLLAAGALLYLGFVVWMGGGFMSGRFFTAPLVLALGAASLQVEAMAPQRRNNLGMVVLVAAVFYSVASPMAPIDARKDYGTTGTPPINAQGIADERAYYYPATGALLVVPLIDRLRADGVPIPPYPGARHGLAFRASDYTIANYNEVGYFGYFAGPDKRVIDVWALCDPWLARIPYVPQGSFRVGHYPRYIAQDFAESRERGRNLMKDPAQRAAYSDVRLMVSGELWSSARWAALWRLNVGAHREAFASAAQAAGPS
jgi:arabinofuranosyltransferase